MAQSKKLFYKTLIFMPNYLRKSTNFKIEAKKNYHSCVPLKRQKSKIFS
jgi:hypothetical protein